MDGPSLLVNSKYPYLTNLGRIFEKLKLKTGYIYLFAESIYALFFN